MSSEHQPEILPFSEAYQWPSLATLYQKSIFGLPFSQKPHIKHIAAPALLTAYQAEYQIANGGTPTHEPYFHGQLINGQFGLQFLDEETKKGVAVCGFSVEVCDDALLFVVSHTGQGNPPKVAFPSPYEMTRDERNRLVRQSQFRRIFMESIVAIALEAGAFAVQVIAAENHPKVASGDIKLHRAVKIIDDVATSCGFGYGQDGNLWKIL